MLECINSYHSTFPNKLTKGKQYRIIDETGIQYKVLDDEGIETWWGKERFVKIDEAK